jgi:hypothetical protein
VGRHVIIRRLDCSSDHPVSVDSLYVYRLIDLLPKSVMMCFLLFKVLAAERSQASRSSGVFAVEVIVVVGIVGVVDDRRPSLRKPRGRRNRLGLQDGRQEGIVVLAQARRVTRDKSLSGRHGGGELSSPAHSVLRYHRWS